MKFGLKIIVGLFLLITASQAGAQTLDPNASAADFSGNWILDRDATTDRAILDRFEEVKLTIAQNGSVIDVSFRGKTRDKIRAQQLKFFTDARGEENPNPLGGEKRNSKTFWSYGNLISEYVVTTRISSDFYRQEARDLWEVSKERDVLTIRTEISEPHLTPDALRLLIRPQKYKKVFRKVS